MSLKAKNVDMCSGPLFKNIFKFVIPLMLTAILSRLYNTADVIVVGRWGGEDALAGVGATGSLVALMGDIFLGLSMGISIMMGKALGAKDDEKVKRTVHTAVALSFIGGIFVTVAGIVFADDLLRLTGVPKTVMPQATIYLTIIFSAQLPSMLYTFVSAIFRAKGNTKTPFYIILITGGLNVLLNIIFVVIFDMKAEGVALATAISTLINAVVITYLLTKETDAIRLDIRKIKIHRDILYEALRLGIPFGVQNSVFEISNTLIQSGVNSFGETTLAGNTAAANILGFFYICIHAFGMAATSFVSQNYGAKKYDRIKKCVWYCTVYVLIVGVLEILVAVLLGEALLNIYIPGNAEAIKAGMVRINVIGFTYAFIGILEVLKGGSCGMGHTTAATLTSVIGVCGIRVVWVLTVFEKIGTLESLLVATPLSWLGTAILQLALYLWLIHPNRLLYDKNHI